MNRPIRDIVQITKATWKPVYESDIVSNISLDSRSLSNNAESLFVALSGPNNDGHHFIGETLSRGVRNFLVERIPDGLADKANFLIVPDTLEALQEIAASHRSQFSFPVVGITGSNGKTIVKEWLNFLLNPDFNIIRSPKSYNSQVGVALSVLGINEKHNFGIFEAGISQPGEMQKLQKIVKPNIGIFTNLGTAHDEGFTGAQQKLSEKLVLFAESEVIICNASLQAPSGKTFTWSFNAPADVTLAVLQSNLASTRLSVSSNGQHFNVEIPFVDWASVENSAVCIATMLYLKYPKNVIADRISKLYPVEMRLRLKNGTHNTTIIDDSYSSDFQSLKIALDFLESQKQQRRKTVILSDIIQSGLPVADLYKSISALLKSNNIDRLIGIGKTFGDQIRFFENAVFFESTEDFLKNFAGLTFSDETILVKGARNFRFERIVSLLEEKTHETVLEINLNAISHNLNFYRSKLNPGTRIMVMVKAFGYGSGGSEIAKLLEHQKADYLGVAFADEGISLANAGIKVPIMVLNPEVASYPAIVQHSLEPEIYSINGLRKFLELAEENQILNYPIHIKLDTGMHRLGIDASQIDVLIEILGNTARVSVKSILSHMATSDDEKHRDFALGQISLFEALSVRIMSALNITPLRHILNSSGISNFPQAQFDMVRLGIGLYGISNDRSEQRYLQNVGTLKSVISQLRTILSGESVGYGRRFVATEKTVIATIPIGYADGVNRHWGNEKGYVTIAGKRAPIVGSVCMDMLMVNCTGINCNEGDSVVIFGEDPSVVQIAEALDTIPYEVLTSISQRVKRTFFRE